MRISDWSSDVCSSDLATPWCIAARSRGFAGIRSPGGDVGCQFRPHRGQALLPQVFRASQNMCLSEKPVGARLEIGRASDRERVCQYVYISEGAEALTKKTYTTTPNRYTLTQEY